MKVKALNVRYLPLYAALAVLAAALIAWPERYVQACFEGIALWAKCVVPALFPFMIITFLMIKTDGTAAAARPFKRVCRALGMPPSGAVIFVISIFSGYPAGSRIVYEYCDRGIITKNDANKLAPLCSTSGPLFLIGSVGQNMLENKAQGATMLAVHIVSVLAIGVIICLFERRNATDTATAVIAPRAGENILYDTFYSAITSVLVAGGFICFFYTVARVADDMNMLLFLQTALTPIFGGDARAACYGLIEATGGCAQLAANGGKFALPLMGFLITFGGFSIIAQQLCYLLKCGVRPLKFIAVKAAQGALCFALLLPFAAI